MLLLYFVAVGLLVGRLTGGRLVRLADVQFGWWPLALAGLVFQALLFDAPIASRVGSLGPVLYVGSTLAVLAALLHNRSLSGFRLIAAGAALNLVVIVANGGWMPSSPEAWQQLNGLAALPTLDYSNSALAGSATFLPFLGDIFVLPRPLPFANVFSIGDVVIGLGAIVFLVRTMHRPVDVDGRPLSAATTATGRMTAAALPATPARIMRTSDD